MSSKYKVCSARYADHPKKFSTQLVQLKAKFMLLNEEANIPSKSQFVSLRQTMKKKPVAIKRKKPPKE